MHKARKKTYAGKGRKKRGIAKARFFLEGKKKKAIRKGKNPFPLFRLKSQEREVSG